MDEEIIRRWNEVVTPDDTVYHLGDFAFKRHRNYMDLLNGELVLVLGSHDKGMPHWFQQKRIDLSFPGIKITLSHYAYRVWPLSHYNSWHLYGHSHGRLPGVGKSMDVGVDTHDFYPYSLEEIIDLVAKAPDNPNYRGVPLRNDAA